MERQEFMHAAVDLAYQNVLAKKGGPFAAVVVKDGKIIGMGTNEVTTSNDPTAHAEIQAIRNACKQLNNFQLTGCEIYSSCEPCPMCLGAIYWARPMALYYAFTRQEAAEIGFDDQFIYDQIALPLDERQLPMYQLQENWEKDPFALWTEFEERVRY